MQSEALPVSGPPTIRFRTTLRGLFSGLALTQWTPPNFYIIAAPWVWAVWRYGQDAADAGVLSTGITIACTCAFLVAVIFGVVATFLVVGLLSRRFRLGEEWEYTFADEHLRVHGSSLDAKIPWASVRKVYETPNRFLVQRSGFAASHISKGGVDSATLETVRGVMRTRTKLVRFRWWQPAVVIVAAGTAVLAVVGWSSSRYVISQSAHVEVFRSDSKAFVVTQDTTHGYSREFLRRPNRIDGTERKEVRRRLQVFEIDGAGVTVSRPRAVPDGPSVFLVQNGALHCLVYQSSGERFAKVLRQGEWADAQLEGLDDPGEVARKMADQGWKRMSLGGSARTELRIASRNMVLESNRDRSGKDWGIMELVLKNAPGPSPDIPLLKLWLGAVTVSRGAYTRTTWQGTEPSLAPPN